MSLVHELMEESTLAITYMFPFIFPFIYVVYFMFVLITGGFMDHC